MDSVMRVIETESLQVRNAQLQGVSLESKRGGMSHAFERFCERQISFFRESMRKKGGPGTWIFI